MRRFLRCMEGNVPEYLTALSEATENEVRAAIELAVDDLE